MDWQLPLFCSAAVFAAFLLWKMRPSFGRQDGNAAAGRAALRAAKSRLAAAKSDEERALALCDAGDASASMLGGATSAVGYYLRAMRTDPRSEAIVLRACRGLARRPRALESLLWRRLGAEVWTGVGEASARRALRELGTLYEGALRNPAKSRAMEYALVALGAPGARPPAASSPPESELSPRGERGERVRRS